MPETVADNTLQYKENLLLSVAGRIVPIYFSFWENVRQEHREDIIFDFVRKVRIRETFSAPDFLYPFIIEAVRLKCQAFTKRQTVTATFQLHSSPDPRHVRTADAKPGSDLFPVCILLFRQGRTGEEATCFPALLIPNPDNSTAAPRPLSGCKLFHDILPAAPPRCRADGSISSLSVPIGS